MTPRWAISVFFLALSVLTLPGFSATAGAEPKTPEGRLRVAVEGNFPPFSEVAPTGELIGFDVDIASALCAQLKRKCELVQQDWKWMIQGLVDGKYDVVISQMMPTDERRRVVDFTDKYGSNPRKFAAAKGKALADTPVGMKGRSIGVLVGSADDSYISTNFTESEIQRFDYDMKLYRALLDGTVDSIFYFGRGIEQQFLKSKYGGGFEFFGNSHSDPDYFGEGVAIAVRENEGELRASLNEAIQVIRANGTYASINSRYFDFDFY